MYHLDKESSAGMDACAYLKQGGKASSDGSSMYIYVPPRR